MERYSRQLLLPEFGTEGQQKLSVAKVLVVGAGGLGSSILLYLAAAGVGNIGVVDNDIVSISNLQRQVLYTTEDTGRLKAEAAVERLCSLNPEIRINGFNEKLTQANALDIFGPYDIIVDGTDNFATRYLVNDACVLLNKPLVYGAVSRYEGQLSVLNTADADGVKLNYRHIFPRPPAFGEVMSCADAGILGVVPGIVGTLQATETIKLITGIGTPLANKLLLVNVLFQQYETIKLSQTEVGPFPKNKAEFLAFDYNWFCNLPVGISVLLPHELEALLKRTSVTLVDVRTYNELPRLTIPHVQLPFSTFIENCEQLQGEHIVFLCQSGQRSVKAAKEYKEKIKSVQKIYSLAGGVPGAAFLYK